MCGQVVRGDHKWNNGGKIKEYPGDEPEGGLPEEIYGFIAAKKLPVPDETSGDDNNTFQYDGYGIDIFRNVILHGRNYEKKTKQHQGGDKQSFHQG